ncbi:elongation of very long chain fatty acids protein 1-like isoform X2 [Phymastichus coffea]|nr:elongation of very long chain fatty acids protein 1-like isoform X2 [Phymastichus coffea]
MEHRKPYSLKTFIFYYNIFQIVSNAIIVYTFYTSGWATEFTLGCEPVRYTTRPIDIRMLNVTYSTLMLKTIDLVETVIFVLRKKYNQITFLHVYHHISTVLVTYICLKYFPGGMLSMQMIINGSVHVIMYTYYLLASLGSSWQNMLSLVKPYITRIQIIQFLFLVWHQAQAFSSSCPVPKFAPALICGNLLLNLALFLNFYRQSYRKRVKST